VAWSVKNTVYMPGHVTPALHLLPRLPLEAKPAMVAPVSVCGSGGPLSG
jgi:hypothetical protein